MESGQIVCTNNWEREFHETIPAVIPHHRILNNPLTITSGK